MGAPLVCEKVVDREAVPPSSCLLSHLRPQGLLLRSLVLTPPARRLVVAPLPLRPGLPSGMIVHDRSL